MRRNNKIDLKNILFVVLSGLFFCCNHKQENKPESSIWLIKDVISTYQEHSLIPENRFVFDKTTYLNKEIHLSDNKIIFDKSLQNSDVYADTLFFKDQFKARKIKDNNLTIQYPGDELNNCLVEKDSCEVGESFLRILGFKGDELMFSIFTTGEPNEYKFKLFYINHKKLALLSDNDFLLFILDKKE